MKKNGILTLLFACVPGAGQMYQGYMKRGLSLITMFCLFIIVGSATGLDALVVGCIVVYMYSFFDTFNLRRCRLIQFVHRRPPHSPAVPALRGPPGSPGRPAER